MRLWMSYVNVSDNLAFVVNPERLRDDLKSWMLFGVEPSTYKSDLEKRGDWLYIL